MPDCPALSTHTQDTVLITKDNLYELLPDTYSLSPGTQVTVSCVNGLRLVGTPTFSCNDNGQWSYKSKPYCTDKHRTGPMPVKLIKQNTSLINANFNISESTNDEPEATDSSADGLDETSKIIIGVVCSVAALIVIALIIMIVVIMYRDRRRRRERREFWESIRKERRGPEFRGADGPSTIDMEMITRYPRALPPPPYEYNYRSNRDRDGERGSRLSHPIHLPGYRRSDYRSHYDEGDKGRRSKSYDDLSESGKKPYVHEWVKRSSMAGSDEYIHTRAGIHGSRQGRDPFLWRQTNY